MINFLNIIYLKIVTNWVYSKSVDLNQCCIVTEYRHYECCMNSWIEDQSTSDVESRQECVCVCVCVCVCTVSGWSALPWQQQLLSTSHSLTNDAFYSRVNCIPSLSLLSDKDTDQTEAHLLAWLGFIKRLGLSLRFFFFRKLSPVLFCVMWSHKRTCILLLCYCCCVN